MRIGRLGTSTLATGLCALALAACGGDDGAPIEAITTSADPEVPASEITVDELVAQADPLCVEANFALAGLDEDAGAGDLVATAALAQNITGDVLRQLRELPTPADGKAPLRRYQAALRRQIDILEQREDAARGGDTTTYEMLGGELAQAKADARLAAEEFGFEECGQEGTSTSEPTDPTGPSAAPSGGAAGTPSGGTPTPATPAPAPAPAPPAPAPPPPPDNTGGAGPDTGGGSGGGGSGGGGSSGGVGPG